MCEQGSARVRHLGKIKYALNNTVNRAIGTTPSRVLFGVDQRGEFVDKISEYLQESVSGPGRDLERIREDANACIKKSQRYNEERAALRRVSVKSFDVGDFVVV